MPNSTSSGGNSPRPLPADWLVKLFGSAQGPEAIDVLRNVAATLVLGKRHGR